MIIDFIKRNPDKRFIIVAPASVISKIDNICNCKTSGEKSISGESVQAALKVYLVK